MKYILILIIVLITAVKLNLIGTGFLAYPDEFRYMSSRKALHDLSEFNIRGAFIDISSTNGRPGDAVLKMIPNSIQYLTAHIFKLNYYESENSAPLFMFNFIIYCLILIVHFKFSKLLLKDSFLALISVLLFSSLTNSYLYLRHSLPYDASLLIFYLVIYKIGVYTEEDKMSLNKSVLLGFFSFMGYMVYPGYFPLLIVGLFLIFFSHLTKKKFLEKILHSGSYGVGGFFCLFIFELMSRFGDRPYIWDALYLSSSVTQGSFEESFTFIVKYLFEVEGLTGIILIISLVLFPFVLVYQIKSKTVKENSLIILLAIGLLGVYLAYASAGYFLHKMVFYGRLLHQYFPFICIFSVYSINSVLNKAQSKKPILLFVISLAFVINFGVNFLHYKSISYPRDIGWELSKTNNLKDIENVCEYDDSWSVLPAEDLFPPEKQAGVFHSILLINGCYIYPVTDMSKYHKFIPAKNYDLVESKPHFINFKAYQYEGYNMVERQNLDKMKLQIKVFSR